LAQVALVLDLRVRNITKRAFDHYSLSTFSLSDHA